ncbi:hypothetical protein EVAR_60100_1 [Eumeta japonica]|uniref:Uncharacterized protein n=1 Tax=Eumeta variegata TaxID=151549 RepID=A0A4C2A5Y4_EUMVA|nr:hypothetical protein EVAR_60100_1 [Eumeta japonica]
MAQHALDRFLKVSNALVTSLELRLPMSSTLCGHASSPMPQHRRFNLMNRIIIDRFVDQSPLYINDGNMLRIQRAKVAQLTVAARIRVRHVWAGPTRKSAGYARRDK